MKPIDKINKVSCPHTWSSSAGYSVSYFCHILGEDTKSEEACTIEDMLTCVIYLNKKIIRKELKGDE